MDAAPRRADVLREVNILETDGSATWQVEHTLIVDLVPPEDDVLMGLSQSTRRQVRKAQSKDGIVCMFDDRPSTGLIERFADRYDAFAVSRGLRATFRPRLEQLSAADMLTFSVATDPAQEVEVQHMHLRNADRAMLLHSVSNLDDAEGEVRNMIGRANRLLHWEGMVHFRNLGCSAYDMGGLDIEEKSPETSAIAKFKRGFGGEVMATHSRVVPVSLKGRIALAALKVAGKSL
ncbi:MAG: hypothetical protein ACI8TP_004071 [Acidimicrobiales bacterium]|jgi:hypothetical protein